MLVAALLSPPPPLSAPIPPCPHSGYPTLLRFPYGKGKKEDEEGIIYHTFGGRVAEDIVSQSSAELAKHGVDTTKIHELVDQSSVDKCLAKRFCAIFVLPHVVDTGAEGRNKHIDTVKAVAKEMGSGNPTSYLWVQGGNQFALEESFRASSYPGLVLINEPRKRFTNHVGSFNTQALVKTLRSVQTGRKAMSEYKAFPKVDKTSEWDGKDYVYEEEEEY